VKVPRTKSKRDNNNNKKKHDKEKTPIAQGEEQTHDSCMRTAAISSDMACGGKEGKQEKEGRGGGESHPLEFHK
jgi:hypothetical protein